MKKNFSSTNYLLSLVVLLPGCGQGPKVSPPSDRAPEAHSTAAPAAKNPSIHPTIPVQTSADPIAQESKLVKIHLEPPSTIGGFWTRRIQVIDARPEKWTVEKQVDGSPFEIVGYTDDKGEFEDLETSTNAQYRLGKIYLTPKVQPAKDLIWNAATPRTHLLKAFRVIVPQDATVFINESTVLVDAQIFQVEGNIRAFDVNRRGNERAGKLILRVGHVSGTGTINLDGMRGLKGQAGPAGAAGTQNINVSQGGVRERANGGRGGDGLAGGTGGGGGSIEVYTAYPETLKLPKLTFQGGEGGEGGDGGAAGAPGTHWVIVNHGPITQEYWERGDPGTAGNPGPKGLSGPAGQIQIYTIPKSS